LPGSPGGNYSLENLPGGTQSGGSGPLTAQERVAVLDGALNQGYEQFDGFILEERARAQAEANAARTAMPGGDGAAESGTGGAASPIIMADRRGGSAQGPQGASGAGGSSGPEETFPPPDDIPSGRDDDVVARQLREAAMREPDPELREALWDEYRRYTGIGTD